MYVYALLWCIHRYLTWAILKLYFNAGLAPPGNEFLSKVIFSFSSISWHGKTVLHCPWVFGSNSCSKSFLFALLITVQCCGTLWTYRQRLWLWVINVHLFLCFLPFTLLLFHLLSLMFLLPVTQLLSAGSMDAITTLTRSSLALNFVPNK